MENYAIVQEEDSKVRTIVQVSEGQAWHCDEECNPILLNGNEECDMGWTYQPGETPRFVP